LATLGGTTQTGSYLFAKECRVSLLLALLHNKFANGVLSKIIIICNLRFRVKPILEAKMPAEAT
jgi:hypothetical protein